MEVNTLAKQMLFCTVKIECELPNAVNRGTGFLVDAGTLAGITPGEGRAIPVLVTNKHVIENAELITLTFIEANPNDPDQPHLGYASVVSFTPEEVSFVGHPDPNVDLTAAPLAGVLGALTVEPFYRALPLDLLPTEEMLAGIDAIEDVTFVGYPNGYSDPANHTPIVRRGITATPIFLDFGGEPVFLIDGSVFGGSSGSPVFVVSDGSFTDSSGGRWSGPSQTHLVGVVTKTLTMTDSLPINVADVPHVKVAHALNLGFAHNHRALRETVVQMAKHYGIHKASEPVTDPTLTAPVPDPV